MHTNHIIKKYREVALGNWGEGSSLLVPKRLTLLPVKIELVVGYYQRQVGLKHTLGVDLGELQSMFSLNVKNNNSTESCKITRFDTSIKLFKCLLLI